MNLKDEMKSLLLGIGAFALVFGSIWGIAELLKHAPLVLPIMFGVICGLLLAWLWGTWLRLAFTTKKEEEKDEE